MTNGNYEGENRRLSTHEYKGPDQRKRSELSSSDIAALKEVVDLLAGFKLLIKVASITKTIVTWLAVTIAAILIFMEKPLQFIDKIKKVF